MGVFADEHRLVERVDILIHPFHTWIHLRIEIAEAVAAKFFSVARSFVVDGTAVQTTGRIVAGLEIAAASGFVTQAPEDDRRMVAVAQHHSVDAVHKGGNPRRHVADRLVGMVFEVGLIHRIKSEVIEHGVHLGRVRIMGGTDGIDVVLLHQQHVTQHRLYRHGTAVEGVRIVSVRTLEEHALAVDVYQRATHFNVSETIFRREGHLVLASLALDDVQCVEVRRLGRPELQVLQRRKQCFRLHFAVFFSERNGEFLFGYQ